jgi:PsbP
MQKFILIFTVILLANTAFSQQAPTVSSYIRNNYKVQYPETWRLDTSRLMGTELFIFAPLENATDQFSENVNLLIQDLTGRNIDLQKYKEITDKQLTDLATDGKSIESAVVKKDNRSYYKTIYTMTQGKLKLKISSICFIKNEKAYLVTFSAEADKYEQYKKTGEGILSSFVVIK